MSLQGIMNIYPIIGIICFCSAILAQDSAPILLSPGDPLLQQRSEEVLLEEIGSKQIQTIINHMFAMANGEREDCEKMVMVGLAAPQIGILKRLILVDVGFDDENRRFGKLTAYINPKITWYSEEIEKDRESCYSIDSRVVGLVPRSLAIHVEALDRQGQFIEANFGGLTARIFQHEIDHLDGLRFPDRVGKDGVLHWVEEEEYSEYKLKSDVWEKHYSWDAWLAMKEGKN